MAASDPRDLTHELAARVRAATAAGTPLRIVGGDTKRWYGRAAGGEPLSIAGHTGVLNYDPGELVLTARGGTRLAEVERLLAENGQCLPFEPPRFGETSTIGGVIAAGLAGPARSWRGPVRDYVLGARVLAGDGRVLRFGGEVMKNVAGYDVSRLLAGSLGILGVILDVSLKVLPQAVATRTLLVTTDANAALDLLATASQRGAPVSASFWQRNELHARLEGSPSALDEISPMFGGATRVDESIATGFWNEVRDQRHAMLTQDALDLWRLHVPALAPMPSAIPLDRVACEWNGAQRWYAGADREVALRIALEAGGHATLYRAAATDAAPVEVFAPLPPALLDLHRRVKRVFDPAGILNPGRMYADL
jgi:glycolate oxidase FAD binding subunit